MLVSHGQTPAIREFQENRGLLPVLRSGPPYVERERQKTGTVAQSTQL